MSGANVSPIGRNKEEWFVQVPIIGSWNKPLFLVSPYRAHIRSAHARLRPLRRLRVFFLMGAATPPLPRRGVRQHLRHQVCTRALSQRERDLPEAASDGYKCGSFFPYA